MRLHRSTAKIVAENILHQIWWLSKKHWHKAFDATNEYVKYQFWKLVTSEDYLNPLVDMAYELWYDIEHTIAKSIVTTNEFRIMWCYMMWKWDTIFYSPGDHMILKWRIKRVIGYYDDIVNYLYITWQLRWYLTIYKDEIEKIILVSLSQRKGFWKSPKQQADSSENLDTGSTKIGSTKYPIYEVSKNPLTQCDAVHPIEDVQLQSKSSSWRTRWWLKKSPKKERSKNSSQSKSWISLKSKKQVV